MATRMQQGWPISVDGLEPIARIGSGGFGTVWIAQQIELDRRVAVKIGHRPFEVDDDRRRFERECKALGRLSGHPNIVEVHTSGISNGLPYLVLEYVEGGTLADHGPQLTEQQLRIVAGELCDAVAAAHAIGVLHRDLKPENVFLSHNGRTVLGDFGIARLGDGNNTVGGGIPASIGFAAPETLSGVAATPAADVYGIGVTIAAAVVGRCPFVTNEGASVEAVVVKVANDPPPDLTQSGMSSEFASLISAAMAKDPAQRPPSAAALGQSIHGLQPRSGSPVPQPNRSMGVALVGVVAALALIAVAAIVLRIDGGEAATDSTTTSSAERATSSQTTTAAPSSQPPTPLGLPLTGPTISNLTGIPLDQDGVDPLLGPADAPQVCDIPPDITGLTDTVAGIYPRDPTTDESFRQVAQRMHRFSTPEDASAFIASYVEIPCESWEAVITSDGLPSTLVASTAPSTRSVGDEINQIDITTTVPAGLPFYSRTVLVRRGADVLKLYYSTLEEADLAPSTDVLLDAAVEALRY